MWSQAAPNGAQFKVGPPVGATTGAQPQKHIFDAKGYVPPCRDRFELMEDFAYKAGATLPLPWAKKDTSAAGAPVTDFVTDADNGHYKMALAADTEVEVLTLYHNDNLYIDAAAKAIFECRLKVASDVTGAGGLFAAGDKLVIGLASAQNDTADSVTRNIWFMFAGANHNIYIEGDDNTTDTDDTDSGVDWAENTFVKLHIDMSSLSAVKFYINDVQVPTTISIAAMSGNLQPFIQLQKASAANKDHALTIDYVRTIIERV